MNWPVGRGPDGARRSGQDSKEGIEAGRVAGDDDGRDGFAFFVTLLYAGMELVGIMDCFTDERASERGKCVDWVYWAGRASEARRALRRSPRRAPGGIFVYVLSIGMEVRLPGWCLQWYSRHEV